MKIKFCLLACLSFPSFSMDQIPVAEKKFSLELSATRLIYQRGGKGVDITVYNKQSFPILAQSKVYRENREDLAPFIVSPPLVRINQGGQTRMRLVMSRDEKALVDDREELYWLCVTGIPPKGGEWWLDKHEINSARININVLVNSCIKVFVRPVSLTSSAHEYGWKLKFKKLKGGVEIINTTPYYINFSYLKIGQSNVDDVSYIGPNSTLQIKNIASLNDNVSWRLVNELGGETVTFESRVSE